MEYIKHKEISYCTVFDLKLSQDELEVYACAMNFLLKNYNDEKIYNITGCTVEELKAFVNDIRDLFIKYVRSEIMPEAYK